MESATCTKPLHCEKSWRQTDLGPLVCEFAAVKPWFRQSKTHFHCSYTASGLIKGADTWTLESVNNYATALASMNFSMVTIL
jgi:hypothetical protein